MSIDNSQLSPREKEVVELLLQGKSNKEIALALSISVRTVEFHLKNIYGKLQVKSRTEAILKLGETTASTKSNKPEESTVDGGSANVENDENTISTRRITLKQPFYIVGGTLLAIVLVTAVLFARLNTNNTYVPPANTLEVSVTASPLMVELGTSFIALPGLGDEGTEDAVIPQSDGMGYTTPQHIEITLANYPLAGTLYKPQISVFPAKELAQMDPSCSKANIDGLGNILKTGQIALAEPLPCDSVEDSLPFVPHQDASQVLHAQEKILSFQNGSGIRYITDYSQAHYPEINNKEVFYTFQGISNDGMYYVSVTLPINLAALDGAQAPITDSEYAAYLGAKKALLNQTDNQFSPSLESLDKLIQSLIIGIQV